MYDAIGRLRLEQDDLDPRRAAALHAVLKRAGPPPEAGGALPPLFHRVHFPAAPEVARPGSGGDPVTGGLIPDLTLPYHAWTGGRLRLLGPLVAGQRTEQRSEVVSVSNRNGRTGPVARVVLRHTLVQDGASRVIEERELTFREDPLAAAACPAAVVAPLDCAAERLRFDPVMLFRFAALTLDSHRIHYDADYAREIEGHAGLVVPPPLLAQLLAMRADGETPLRRFSYRSLRPLTIGEEAVANARGGDFWVRSGEGDLVFRARAGW